MNTIIKPTIIITAVAIISSFILSHVDKITKPNILKQKMERQEQALSLVLPGYRIAKEIKTTVDNEEFHYWIAEKEIEGRMVAGHAFLASSHGYGGDVESIVGVDADNVILGISILNQTETPGLGARCIEVATTKTFLDLLRGSGINGEEDTTPWFQKQFSGLTLNSKINIVKKGDWSPAIKDELIGHNAITAITGATITGRAVIASMDKGFARLQKVLAAQSAAEGGQK